VIHVIPVAEEHEATSNCKCAPEKFTTQGKVLFLHQSQKQQGPYILHEENEKQKAPPFKAL